MGVCPVCGHPSLNGAEPPAPEPEDVTLLPPASSPRGGPANGEPAPPLGLYPDPAPARGDAPLNETLLPPSTPGPRTAVREPPDTRGAQPGPTPSPAGQALDQTLPRPAPPSGTTQPGTTLPYPPPAEAGPLSEQTLPRPSSPGSGSRTTEYDPDNAPLTSDGETLPRPSSSAGPPTVPHAPSSVPLPARAAGDPYEILGVLGRGGMGIVYKARQVALNRIVALKMILSGAHAGAEDLARFHTEAQAVARLQHPNIVQVYDHGDRDGKPYFALEFVDGGSLQQQLKGAPMPPRQAARLMETLARAMHYAHERGIVHRDLKPANVLLTADGTPKITDFGLAKRLDQEDLGNTGTEAILGTPMYMAPEQAQGKARHVGPAADVYSLGAVFYDLLTGRPPFKGTTVLDTLQLVQSAEPVPPIRLEPTVPADLQTVCLKCLEKEPRKRYGSAGELADDLRRFLDGEPILARPVSQAERAWKWAKRRPAAAALVAVSAVALLGFGVGGVAFAWRTQGLNKQLMGLNQGLDVLNKDLDEKRREAVEAKETAETNEREAKDQRKRAESEEQKAKTQKERAQQNFLRAQAAVDELIRVAQKTLADAPGMEQERRRLLERAVGFYKAFLDENEKDPLVKLQAARARRGVGDIRQMLGDHALAEQAYLGAVDLYRELQSEYRGQADAPKELAKVPGERAGVLLNQWAVQRAQPDGDARAACSLQDAIDTLEQLVRDDEANAGYRRDLAAAYNNCGIHQQLAGQGAEATAVYEQALALLARLSKDDPGKADYQQEAARTEVNLGVTYLALPQPQPQKARARFEAAVKRLTGLVEANPKDPNAAKELGRAYSLWALGLQGGCDTAAAERIHRDAVALFRRLAGQFEAVPDYRHLHAVSLINLGNLLRDPPPAACKLPEPGREQLLRAQQAFTDARALLDPLADAYPLMPTYRQGLVRALTGLGAVQGKLGHPDNARTTWEQALREANLLPDSTEFRQDQARCHNNLGFLLAGVRKDSAGAKKHYAQAVAILEAVKDPGADVLQDLAAVRTNQAALAQNQPRLDEAVEPLGKLVVLRQKLVERFPNEPKRKEDLAGTLLALAKVQVDLGNHAAAARAVQDLAAVVDAKWEKYPRAAGVLGRCMALADAEQPQLAHDYGEHALKMLTQAAAAGSLDAEYLRNEDFLLLRTRAEFKARFEKLLADLRAKKTPGP